MVSEKTMSLPVIQAATYTLEIPSTKKKIRFRPFLVREQRALLHAQQSEESTVMVNTLRDVIRACTFNEVDVDSLSSFDIEYIFIQLRSRSVGETTEFVFSCLECNDPNAKIPVRIDLTGIEVQYQDNHKKDISLTDSIGVKMKYPSIELLSDLQALSEDDDLDKTFSIIGKCIESIYDDNNVYSTKDYKDQEILEFLNSLTSTQYSKIREFFDTMPRLEKKLEFDCPVCGYHHTQILRGMNSFF